MVKKYVLKTKIKHNYFLIAIKTVLEDYRLAYYLNEKFDLQFKKEDYSLNFPSKEGSFTVFGFENPVTSSYWSLIANKQVVEKKVNASMVSLFDEISNTYVLITEKKKIDYFIKIETNYKPEEKISFIKKINAIHRVITSYEIDPNTLKSKEFLIF